MIETRELRRDPVRLVRRVDDVSPVGDHTRRLRDVSADERSARPHLFP